jgi:predicted dehydrogenase
MKKRAAQHLRFGLTGLGGFSHFITERFLDEMGRAAHQLEGPNAQLCAVADPYRARYRERASQLGQLGVSVYEDFNEMLASAELDAVWMPLPIHLHREYTAQALSAGVAVMCEKPAAGSVQEVDAMIADRNRFASPLGIAFQDLYDPAIRLLKRQLVAGEWGRMRRIHVTCAWPRPESYYARNSWAGRWGDAMGWISDSPASNAMAHFLNLGLFLAGESEHSTARALEVEAELYRVNAIETFDTCSLRLSLSAGIELVAGFSHASERTINPCVRIETEAASIRAVNLGGGTWIGLTIEPRDGSPIVRPESQDPWPHMFRAMRRAVLEGDRRGESSGLVSPEMAREHVRVVNAAAEATEVSLIPAAYARVGADENGHPRRMLEGVDRAIETLGQTGELFHESGNLKWSRPAGRLDVRDYQRFRGPKGTEQAPGTRPVELRVTLPDKKVASSAAK